MTDRFEGKGLAMSTTSVHVRPEALIRYLAEGTASQTGQEFLQALVRSAAQAMDVAGVWVTEYLPQQKVLKSLAFWMNGEYVYDFEYRIENTPCERVVEEKRLVHIPDRVIELFPNDPDLCTLNAVSYAGVPLLRSDGSVWGASNVCRAVHLWVRLDFNGCSSRGSCAYSRTSAGGTGGDGKARRNYRTCVREWFDYSSNRKWVLRLVRKTVY